MSKQFLFSACGLLLFTATLNAQIKSAKLLRSNVVLYHKSEWNISLIAKWSNPYLQEDITVDMLLTAPSGKKLILPCYYVSGVSGKPSLWKARFTPQEHGVYHYSFVLKKEGAITSTFKTAMFTAAASSAKGFLHPNDNWTFKFDNGKRFRGIGENIGWESRASDDSKYFKELHQQPKYNYDYMLKSLAKHGGNFYRTWISRWNLPLDWHDNFNNNRYTASDEYFNPSAIKRMDKLVNLSDSLGIYMMLTLGMGAYEVKDGGFSPNAADFFVNPQSKARYKDRLRYIIARWGYSPSIAAWELFNEVDNVQFADKDKPIDPETIVAWHNEMSTYIKSIDPYQHMVTTSISHRDLKGLNSLKSIDFNQKHIYKNTAAISQAITDYKARFQKPYVIGEYGYEWDWSKNFDDFAPQMDSDFKRGLWYGLFSPTPILPMSWWWEYFDNRGTDKYFSKIKQVSDWMLKNSGSFQIVEVSTTMPEVKVMAVKTAKDVFLYFFNSGKEMRSGIIELSAKINIDSGGSSYTPDGEILEMLPPIVYKDKKAIIDIHDLAPGVDQVYIIKSQ